MKEQNMSNNRQLSATIANREGLRRAWQAERAAARAARASGDVTAEWHHLERAHVLSQPMAAAHVRTHLAMLSFAVRAHDVLEMRGQLFRLAVAGPGSWSGRYPAGNTGGAAISAFTVLPVPDDLRAHLQWTS
jgi:hypothetical protein